MKNDKIIFTNTEIIDDEVFNTYIYDSSIKEKYSKSYFDMTLNEKEIAENYFCN